MSKRLILFNVLFLAAAAVAGTYIVRDLSAPQPRSQPVRPRPAQAPLAASTAPETPAPPPAPGSYAVVASRNLFSPTRSETPPGATAQAARPTPAPVKPNLHGVVLRDGTPVAYLEDPSTKRVAGYRLGDSIGGGTVQAIHADHVVLARPEGNLDVRLRDPSKPRPPAPPSPQPAQRAPGAGVPGQVQPPGTPPTIQPGYPTAPGMPVPRRPLPPSVLRRVPPATSDAAQR
ncbi:MAG: hypothetical protein HYU51_10015 [Candidatus Rokubacteria bacterium]|nr:hypothetical protein [Candidatus Rokubacteria bacterium]